MDLEGVTRIDDAAERAIREAAGDWKAAHRLLRESVDLNERLRDDLVTRSLHRELRDAAVRLGTSTVPCPSCGEDIPVDATQCRLCGESFEEPVSSSAPLPPPRAAEGGPIIRHFTLLAGWILIVLIVILIISFAT